MGYPRSYLNYFKKRMQERDANRANNSTSASFVNPEMTNQQNAESQVVNPNEDTEETDHGYYQDPDDGFEACECISDVDEDDLINPSAIPDDDDSDVNPYSKTSSDDELENTSSDEEDLDSLTGYLPYFSNRTYECTTEGLSLVESCSFALMRKLDRAGAPRYLFNDIKGLLRKQVASGFEVKDLLSREVLMKSAIG